MQRQWNGKDISSEIWMSMICAKFALERVNLNQVIFYYQINKTMRNDQIIQDVSVNNTADSGSTGEFLTDEPSSWQCSVTFLVLHLQTSYSPCGQRSGGKLFSIHECITVLIESNQAHHMASHSNWPDPLLAQSVKTRRNRPAHESCNRQKSSLIAMQKCQAKSLAAGAAHYCSHSPKTPFVISPALSFPLSFQGLT